MEGQRLEVWEKQVAESAVRTVYVMRPPNSSTPGPAPQSLLFSNASPTSPDYGMTNRASFTWNLSHY